MARVKSYTPEQVEFIRERAATMTDPQLGELMGLPGWKVLHIRQREKIRSGRRLPEDVEALAAEAIRLYIHEGLTSVETGKRLGISDKAVRMICHKRGLKQPPGHRAANFLTIIDVTPAVWKSALRVRGDKDESRQRASALFPRYADAWSLKKHDGRAEAALIAYHGARQSMTAGAA